MNSQYFNKEQIQAGEMQKLLDFLMSEAYGTGGHYNDIHIRPEDLGAFVIEWEQVPWSHDYGGRFEYIDEEHVIMLEARFPDGTGGVFFDEDDYEEQLKDWLDENPGWAKDSFGHWYNKESDSAQLRSANAYSNMQVSQVDDDKEVYHENGIPQ